MTEEEEEEKKEPFQLVTALVDGRSPARQAFSEENFQLNYEDKISSLLHQVNRELK